MEEQDQDEEFDYDYEGTAATSAATKERPKSRMLNQPFDESVELSEETTSEHVISAETSPVNKQDASSDKLGTKQDANSDDLSKKEEKLSQREAIKQDMSKMDSDDDSDHDDQQPLPSEEAATDSLLYNPNDYRDLNVSQEIKDLFEYIGRYKPVDITLETKLIPFVPDYIPAVGDIDTFVKVPRPDDQKDGLGLTVLDEPSAQQSDPTVLDLQLRVISKQSNVQPVTVRSIEHADKNPQKITTWINNIQEVHKQKPSPSVTYTKTMPSTKQLIQMWPAEFEQVLNQTELPSADMDISLQEYAKIICAILDIPMHEKLTHSLHLLFTLYSELKNNQQHHQ